MHAPDPPRPAAALGLGLDAGGTHTRWAVADAGGALQAEGEAAPVSGLQLAGDDGRAALRQVLQAIATAAGPVAAAAAGVTGLDEAQAPLLRTLVAEALRIAPAAVLAFNDVELLCRAAFAPGQGVVLVAGTGSIAAHVGADGALQRAGGRGALIDDAGGGHWIAREALRSVWRAEDARPGAWRDSPLARRLFARIGGDDWAATRRWVYGASRGELGTLATAVAAAAGVDRDPVALALLQAAGHELARLPLALHARLGPQPVMLAGRVFTLHPAVEQALRAALPPTIAVQHLPLPAHHMAARLAARQASIA